MGKNLNIHVTKIQKYLKNQKMLCDGAFGTYYAMLYDTDELPEKANLLHPERVIRIHKEYIDSGAVLIRTNTFATNTKLLQADIKNVEENIKRACALARDVAGSEAYIAGDIGPIPYENQTEQKRIQEQYIRISEIMLQSDVDAICFETFAEIIDILPAIRYIRQHSDKFIIVQFAITQFGYSNAGLSVRKLLKDASEIPEIDAVGLNCGIGPGHMEQILSKENLLIHKYITAFPNAGYPQATSNRLLFTSDNVEYFTQKTSVLSNLGIHMLGGCCGTTPEYIASIRDSLDLAKTNPSAKVSTQNEDKISIINNAFYHQKEGKKLIAVELAPPLDSNDDRLIDAAYILKKSHVDVVTFPDSPSGRTRADSILMAEKVSNLTGLCVMPHLCCRDKNAIAMRSQLLGAHINKINNFLVITGDPIPSMVRQSVKSVFNFDSVGLMNIISDMNDEQFAHDPAVYGGAINQNRLHLDLEIERVKKKMAAGATFFMTQPVFSRESADRIREIKDRTGARILCGIMPLVSRRNALFMKNEMTGIDVTQEIVERYPVDANKAEGEAVGIAIAKEMIHYINDFTDGYYFSFPFNRVYLLSKIME